VVPIIRRTLLHAVDDGVGHFVVRHMSPPEQHVTRGEFLDRQPVLRLVEGGGIDHHVLVSFQKIGDHPVDSLGVDGPDSLVLALVDELVPDQNVDGAHAWCSPVSMLPRIWGCRKGKIYQISFKHVNFPR